MGLKDKASKINFASLMTQHVPATEIKQPKTAPGAMMAYANDARSDLIRENEVLREQASRAAVLEVQRDEALDDLRAWDGAKPARLLAPTQVRSSRYANRHESSYIGADFENLKRDIQEARGNVQPIKVRPVGEGEGDGTLFEVVYGHRRLEACRQLGLPVLAVIDNLDDRTLFIEMERENRGRADLSPWEQGVMYARALETGLFSSNRQLASAIGVDHSNLGKSLALARLPTEIIEAFATPLDIQLRWASLLNYALEKDAKRTKDQARTVSKKRAGMSAKDVLAFIVASGEGDEHDTSSEDGADVEIEVEKQVDFRYNARGQATVKILVPLTAAQKSSLEKLIMELISGV
jgi:ParB family chromosome partitioning protein